MAPKTCSFCNSSSQASFLPITLKLNDEETCFDVIKGVFSTNIVSGFCSKDTLCIDCSMNVVLCHRLVRSCALHCENSKTGCIICGESKVFSLYPNVNPGRKFLEALKDFLPVKEAHIQILRLCYRCQYYLDAYINLKSYIVPAPVEEIEDFDDDLLIKLEPEIEIIDIRNTTMRRRGKAENKTKSSLSKQTEDESIHSSSVGDLEVKRESQRSSSKRTGDTEIQSASTEILEDRAENKRRSSSKQTEDESIHSSSSRNLEDKRESQRRSSSRWTNDSKIRSESTEILEDRAVKKRRPSSKQTDYKNIQSASIVGLGDKSEKKRSSISRQTDNKKIKLESPGVVEHNLRSVSILLSDIRKDDSLQSRLGLEQKAQGLWRFSLDVLGGSKEPTVQRKTRRKAKDDLKQDSSEVLDVNASKVKRENEGGNQNIVIKRTIKSEKRNSEIFESESVTSGQEKYSPRRKCVRSSLLGNSSNKRQKDNELVESPPLKQRRLMRHSLKLENSEEDPSVLNSSQNDRGNHESHLKIDDSRPKRSGCSYEGRTYNKPNEKKNSDKDQLQNIRSRDKNEPSTRSSEVKALRSARVQKNTKTTKYTIESDISNKKKVANQFKQRSETKRKSQLDDVVEIEEILTPRKRVVKCQIEWCSICGIQVDSVINRLEHEFSHEEPRKLSVSLHRCYLNAPSVKLPVYVNHEEVQALKSPQEDNYTNTCTDNRPLLKVDDVLNDDEYHAYDDYSYSEGEDENLKASECMQIDSPEKISPGRIDEKDPSDSIKMEKSKKKGHVKMRLWNDKPVQTTRFGRVVKLTKKYEALSSASCDLSDPSLKMETTKSQSTKVSVDIVDHLPEEDVDGYVEVVVTKEQREKPDDVIDLMKKDSDMHISCRSNILLAEDAIQEKAAANSEVIMPVLEEESNGNTNGKTNEDTKNLDLIQVLNSESKVIVQENSLKNINIPKPNDIVVMQKNLEHGKFQDLVSKRVEENVINKSLGSNLVISENSGLEPDNILIEADGFVINTSPANLDKGNSEEDVCIVENISGKTKGESKDFNEKTSEILDFDDKSELASEAMDEIMEITGNVVSKLKEVVDKVVKSKLDSSQENIDVQSREGNDEVGISVNIGQTDTVDGVMDVAGDLLFKSNEVADMVEQSNLDSTRENIDTQSREDTEEVGVHVSLETEADDDVMDVAGDLLFKSSEVVDLVEQSKLALTQEKTDAESSEISNDGVGVPLNLETETQEREDEVPVDEIIPESFDLESRESNNEKEISENGSITENLESKLEDDGNQVVHSEIEGVWGNSESSEADELRMCGNRDETVFGKDVTETLDAVTSGIEDEMDPFELKNLSSNDVSDDLSSRPDEMIRFERAESEESENVNFKLNEVVNEDREIECNLIDTGLEDISDGEFELDDDTVISTENNFRAKSVKENEGKSGDRISLESIGTVFVKEVDEKTISIESRKRVVVEDSVNDRNTGVCNVDNTLKGNTETHVLCADDKTVNVLPFENEVQPYDQVVQDSNINISGVAVENCVKGEGQISHSLNRNTVNNSLQTKECDVSSLDRFTSSKVSNGDEKTVVCCK